ncbi:hypothetical protein [Pseudomonas phage 98PfluR60PP]|uniref:Uncharacterized protein n=1 Tax=Pseudomonas phage 98PfluR60PP TaxID=2163965 RepID=A0A2S1PG12_9CAUD|nr:hypothetical protein PP760_gp68 [Pseudomonas phage 98PfluR60PP]AWH15500.1 hypothetical protein [Pseudomonas phage 98PfluR60PP]
MTQTQLPKGCKFVRMEDAGRFMLPSQAIVVHAGLIDELEKGDYVKVTVDFGEASEKFWCDLMGYDPETGLMELRVANDLVYTKFHGLDDGHIIFVEKQYLCAAIKE